MVNYGNLWRLNGNFFFFFLEVVWYFVVFFRDMRNLCGIYGDLWGWGSCVVLLGFVVHMWYFVGICGKYVVFVEPLESVWYFVEYM